MILNDSPATILRQFLIDVGVGSETVSENRLPIGVNHLMETPDNVLAIYDTSPVLDGRLMEGEYIFHPGLQIRVRQGKHSYTTLSDIIRECQKVANRKVIVESTVYYIKSIGYRGSLYLGVDNLQRREWTINLISTMKAKTE